MKFDPNIGAYRLDDGDLAYRLFKQDGKQEAECGVCGDEIEVVDTKADFIDDDGDGLGWSTVTAGYWVSFAPCGHRVYVRSGQTTAVVVEFPASADTPG